LARRRGRSAPPAIALVVAAVLHTGLAEVGWYERYQAYLVALGVYVLLGVLAEVPRHLRTRLLWAIAGLGLALGALKANLVVKAPLAADDMYRQQYHAARFLERYDEGEPVATDQLGYISWFHGGPITDFAGLGDREGAGARRRAATRAVGRPGPGARLPGGRPLRPGGRLQRPRGLDRRRHLADRRRAGHRRQRLDRVPR